MNILDHWARKNNISPVALLELRMMMGVVNTEPQSTSVTTSEAAVQNKVRLEASQVGARLWRNNVGAYLGERGIPVRYGLCNESKQMNKICKSSDLIGIKPVLITPDMVGCIIGQFLAREVKKSDWVYNPNDPHENGQLTFLNLVVSLGGDAAFCNSVGSL